MPFHANSKPSVVLVPRVWQAPQTSFPSFSVVSSGLSSLEAPWHDSQVIPMSTQRARRVVSLAANPVEWHEPQRVLKLIEVQVLSPVGP